MKIFKFIALIIVITTTTPIFQSCMDTDSRPSDLLVISTIHTISQDSRDFFFTLDDGKKMFPSNGQVWSNTGFADGQRAFVMFNELEEPVGGYDYNVQVKQIREILTKDIIAADDTDNTEETIGDDKINTTYMWIDEGKKYLTIEFQFYGTLDEDKKHFLNLVIPSPAPAEEEGNEDNPYIDLEFRHNSEGDSAQSLTEGYVSFKLDGVEDQMEGRNGLRIRVNTLYEGIKTYEVNFAD